MALSSLITEIFPLVKTKKFQDKSKFGKTKGRESFTDPAIFCCFK